MTLIDELNEKEYENYIFVRCEGCHKLLFKVKKRGESIIEIKCPRCKMINTREV